MVLTQHKHSPSSTHHQEAVSAVWLISKRQPEYLEAPNPETLPFGNFHILHIQTKRHTHARELEMKTTSVPQQQTNTQVVKSIMYAQQDCEGPVLCYIGCSTLEHRQI